MEVIQTLNEVYKHSAMKITITCDKNYLPTGFYEQMKTSANMLV